MLSLSDYLEKANADIVSLTQKIDTATAAGKMVFKMMAVLNEFERDQISERTKLALSHKKSAGQSYSPTPYGFKSACGYKAKRGAQWYASSVYYLLRRVA